MKQKEVDNVIQKIRDVVKDLCPFNNVSINLKEEPLSLSSVQVELKLYIQEPIPEGCVRGEQR